MLPKEYNRRQYEKGKLNDDHIVELVKLWQQETGLNIDGKAGPKTISTIFEDKDNDFVNISELLMERIYPLKILADGRKPIITSGFKDDNKGRSTHDGIDFFYAWLDSDPDVFSGRGGAIKKGGRRRWWYPNGHVAVAAASGVVQEAEMLSKGFRVWIDHGNGERTGYFHGARGLVSSGQVVSAGTPVIEVGDNPSGGYKKHLHFEVSPANRYQPKNPRIWLKDAKYI